MNRSIWWEIWTRSLIAMLYAFSLLMLVVMVLLVAKFATSGNPFAKKSVQPIGNYAVDKSPSYLVCYAVEAFPGALQRR